MKKTRVYIKYYSICNKKVRVYKCIQIMMDLDLFGLGSCLFFLKLTSSGLLCLVSDTIKVDKQQKVRREKSTTENSRGFSTSTATHIGQMRPVSGSKVSISTEIDHKQVDDELSDLECSQVLFPPNLGTSSSTEVVIVHQYMHSQVQSDRYPRLLKTRGLVFPCNTCVIFI